MKIETGISLTVLIILGAILLIMILVTKPVKIPNCDSYTRADYMQNNIPFKCKETIEYFRAFYK